VFAAVLARQPRVMNRNADPSPCPLPEGEGFPSAMLGAMGTIGRGESGFKSGRISRVQPKFAGSQPKLGGVNPQARGAVHPYGCPLFQDGDVAVPQHHLDMDHLEIVALGYPGGAARQGAAPGCIDGE